MRKAILFLALEFLFCGLQESRAAVFSSSQNGNWSSSATWGNAGVPGNGDTVTITHQVTVTANVTMGHSPGTDAAAAAVRIASSGHLILNPGITLVCRGDLRLQPGYLTLQAGSVLEMDASQAAAPATSVYKIDIRPDSASNNALLTVNGTTAAHCEIRANALGAHARITDGAPTANGGRMIADYCDFKRLGGNPDYQAWYYYPTGSGDLFRIRYCTFDQCSRVSARYDMPAGSRVEFLQCAWTNSVSNPGGNGYWQIYTGGAEYGAIMKMMQCSFDKLVYLGRARDYEIEDCVFAEGIRAYNDNAGHSMKSFKRNFMRWVEPASIWNLTFGNTIEDCVFVKDVENNNPHYVTVTGGTGALTIRGNVMWFTGNNYNYAEGDGFMLGRPSSGARQENTVLMEKNIVLPSGQGPDGYNNLSCTPFTILLGVTYPFQVVFRRNTVYAGFDYGGCNVGETETAQAGSVAYFKSNLFVGTDRGGGSLAGRKLHNLGNAETDVVLAANADYNGSFRLAPGDNYGNGSGKGYHRLEFSGSAVIGAHDLDDTNPQFADNTRTPATWDAHLGGAGTLQGALAHLAPGGGHTLPELLDYIREGFRPQNPVLQSAGDPDDGSPDIGAVDMNPPLVAAPANLAAAAGGQTQIHLTWDDASNNEEEFRIERSLTSNNAGFTQIATTGAGTENYTNTGLTPGTTYYYRVRACGPGTCSAYSNQAWAITESAGQVAIAGTVTLNGIALAGVVLNGLPGNPVTNAAGQYTAIVNQGWSGTVTPSLAGYTFNPANRTYNNVTANQGGQSYTASASGSGGGSSAEGEGGGGGGCFIGSADKAAGRGFLMRLLD